MMLRVRIAQQEIDRVIVAWCFFDTRCVNYKPKQISAASSGIAGGSSSDETVEDGSGWTSWAWMRVHKSLSSLNLKQFDQHLLECAVKHRWRDGGCKDAPSKATRRMIDAFQDALAKEIFTTPFLTAQI